MTFYKMTKISLYTDIRPDTVQFSSFLCRVGNAESEELQVYLKGFGEVDGIERKLQIGELVACGLILLLSFSAVIVADRIL